MANNEGINPALRERLARLEDLKQALREFKAKNGNILDAKEEYDFILVWASKFGLTTKTAKDYYIQALANLRLEKKDA